MRPVLPGPRAARAGRLAPVLRAAALACLVLAAGHGPARAQEAASDADGGGTVRLGVAAFEQVPAGAAVPDVAALLGDRLVALGRAEVVGPARLAAPAQAEPSAEDVRAWAERGDVDAVVTGRTTRKGSALTLDVWLRDGRDGGRVGAYVAQVARPEELAAAVQRIADEIAGEGLAGLAARGTDVAAAGRAPSPAGSQDESAGALPLELGGVRKDAPLSIQSDELEAVQNPGGRRFIFTGNVRVRQDTMRLQSDRLEAIYPPEGNQPERLIATGRVVVTQKDQEARCDTATYVEPEQRIFCRGNAELRQGADRVRGQEIEIRLDSEQLIVRGGAEVHIQPKAESEEAAPEPGGRQGG